MCEVQARHRVVGIGHDAIVLGRDLHPRETIRQRRAADQNRASNAGGFQVLRRRHHHLCRFDQQSGKAESVRLMRFVGFDQLFGRNLDAEIDYTIAVVGQNNIDQVLADIVNVALDCREHDRALAEAIGLLHVRFEMGNGGLHRFG